jgi:hypothetical protein
MLILIGLGILILILANETARAILGLLLLGAFWLIVIVVLLCWWGDVRDRPRDQRLTACLESHEPGEARAVCWQEYER